MDFGVLLHEPLIRDTNSPVAMATDILIPYLCQTILRVDRFRGVEVVED